MGLPYLKMEKCCFLKLPTLGIVIGVLGTIISGLKAFECVWRLLSVREFDESQDDESYERFHYRLVTAVIYYDLIPSLAYMLSCILVIIGIKKNYHLILIPWLIINLIFVVCLIPPFLIFFSFAGFRGSVLENLTIIAVMCLFITAFSWMWIIIFSLFEDMRVKRNLPIAANQKNVPTSSPHYQAVQYNA